MELNIDQFQKLKEQIVRIIQANYNYDAITIQQEMEDGAESIEDAIIQINTIYKRPIVKDKKLYFWGYGNTPCNKFEQNILAWSADLNASHLIDIRAYPMDWAYCYRKAWLEKYCANTNLMTYIYIKELSNPTDSLDLFKNEYIRSSSFMMGLITLLEILADKETQNCVLFCAELYYMNCHRHVIAELLMNRPFFLDVIHLSPAEKIME
jgi:hypothetical protein